MIDLKRKEVGMATIKKRGTLIRILLLVIFVLVIGHHVYETIFLDPENIMLRVSEKLEENRVTTIYNINGCDWYYDLDGNVIGDILPTSQCNPNEDGSIEINYILLFDNENFKYIGKVSSSEFGASGLIGTTYGISLVNEDMEYRVYYATFLSDELFVSYESNCYYVFDYFSTNCDIDDIVKGKALREEHRRIFKEWGITAEDLGVYFTELFREYMQPRLAIDSHANA